MKIRGFLFGLLFSFAWSACEENLIIENEKKGSHLEDVVGNWIHPQYNDSTVTYERSGNLADNDYGFSFRKDGVFIERKNIGWCGTPPICYGDFDGTWTQNDSVLNINVAYWGGMADYKWKIVSVDIYHLTIMKLEENYHMENE
jgi:hypothetical protein